MKRHISISELVEELKNENLKKFDIVLPSTSLRMENGELIITNTGNRPELAKILHESGIDFSKEGEHGIRLQCLGTLDENLAEKLGIPSRYYQRMKTSALGLLDENVSYWLKNVNNNYLLRSFVDKQKESGVARALLSDRFRTIDNFDILMAALSAVKESGINIQVRDCDLSERRMYMRFVVPEIEIQAPELLKNYRPGGQSVNTGDGIITGFEISNSEIGCGKFNIAGRAEILKCKNGMRNNEAFAKTHLGAQMGEYSTIQWSEDSKQKNLELIISQIKDAVKHFCSAEYLGKLISDTIAKNKELEHPMDAIKQATMSLEISEDKQNDILNHFIKSGDLTGFGISQAITLYAHTQGDADLQYDLERAAADVLDQVSEFDKPMPKKTTKTLEKLN